MFFSIANETICPSCESRVENFWSVIRDLGSVVAKRRKWDRVFFFLIKNTEQNSPLVLKRNQLFRVPNHERSKLALYL